MPDKDGVRDISSGTLHINPLTRTPYSIINKFTYDCLTKEVQELYRKDPRSLSYAYFGKLEKKDE